MTENSILEKIPNIIFKKEFLIVNTKSLSVSKLSSRLVLFEKKDQRQQK